MLSPFSRRMLGTPAPSQRTSAPGRLNVPVFPPLRPPLPKLHLIVAAAPLARWGLAEQLGVDSARSRSAALFQLAAELPAADCGAELVHLVGDPSVPHEDIEPIEGGLRSTSSTLSSGAAVPHSGSG
jgi:hypothetical protein